MRDLSSLYIHIPYCRSKCIYCDFFSGGVRSADWSSLTSSLIEELKSRISELSDNLISIYLGGGTPSLIPVGILPVFFDDIRKIIGGRLRKGAEITLEVNPEDVTPEAVEVWKECGINRISCGIQSLDDNVLKLTGRNHSAVQAMDALELICRNFNNVSTDMIFGLPGQNSGVILEDLGTILKFGVSHISCYSLMIEKGTALGELIRQERISLPDEDIIPDIYTSICNKLSAEGFRHYEISNFALPGFESRHNSGYWTGRRYLGIGPAAHSFDGKNIRRSNPWKLKEYLNFDFSKTGCGLTGHDKESDSEAVRSPFYQEEILNEDELLEEFIMLNLRREEGIDLNDFKEKFGERKVRILLAKAREFLRTGWLDLRDNHLKLTRGGIMISDRIISSLF